MFFILPTLNRVYSIYTTYEYTYEYMCRILELYEYDKRIYFGKYTDFNSKKNPQRMCVRVYYTANPEKITSEKRFMFLLRFFFLFYHFAVAVWLMCCCFASCRDIEFI